jgi:hypothetical protein
MKKKRGKKKDTVINNNEFNKINLEDNNDLIVINLNINNNNPLTEYTKELDGYNNDKSCICEYSNDNKNTTCWNCCHEYNGREYMLPMKYVDNIFYSIGSFCSFNCIAKYLVDNYNGKELSYLYSLLNIYYNISISTVGNHVKPAASKFTLKKYGGDLTIDEYRSLFDNYIHYETIIPPIMPINNKYEIIDKYNKDSVSDNKKTFKLYRTKKKNENNNIFSSMNLIS